MCNGGHDRPIRGGTIAVLKAPIDFAGSCPQQEVPVRFTDDAASGFTTAAIGGLRSQEGENDIVVHRDGDLTSAERTAKSVLYRFTIPTVAQEGAAFSLGRALNLSVGADGIIGRGVSLLQGHVLLGEGIIGWN